MTSVQEAGVAPPAAVIHAAAPPAGWRHLRGPPCQTDASVSALPAGPDPIPRSSTCHTCRASPGMELGLGTYRGADTASSPSSRPSMAEYAPPAIHLRPITISMILGKILIMRSMMCIFICEFLIEGISIFPGYFRRHLLWEVCTVLHGMSRKCITVWYIGSFRSWVAHLYTGKTFPICEKGINLPSFKTMVSF